MSITHENGSGFSPDWTQKQEAVRSNLPPGVEPMVQNAEGVWRTVGAEEWLPGVNTLYDLTASGATRQKPQTAERVRLTEGQRPFYDAHTGAAELQEVLEAIPAVQSWNSPLNEEGKREALYLPDMPELRALTVEFLRESNSLCLIPFAGERDSIAANAEYAIKTLGDPHRVILSDAGYDSVATQKAKETGAIVVDQQAILRDAIDWEALQSRYGLPFSKDALPKGKAETLAAGYFTAYALGLANEETIMFHKDSDVIWSDPDNPPPNQSRSYDDLPTLALPFALQREGTQLNGVIGRKHFRDNEHMKIMADVLKRNPDRLAAYFGYFYASMVQPVSDARAGRWGNGKDIIGFADIPWGTSIAYEDIQVIGMAGASLEAGKKLLGQVAIAGPKIENAPSEFQREISLSAHMSDAIHSYISHIGFVHGNEVASQLLSIQDVLPDNLREDLLRWKVDADKYPDVGYETMIKVLPRILEQLPAETRAHIYPVLDEAWIASLPHRWGPNQIKQFNQMYGGIGYHHDLPGKVEADYNHGMFMNNEWMFPGPAKLIKEGLVDLDFIRHWAKKNYPDLK